jgi:hypothetical protein
MWRVWVCEPHGIVAVPQGIIWTAYFLGEFCAAAGGCPIHPSAVGAEKEEGPEWRPWAVDPL